MRSPLRSAGGFVLVTALAVTTSACVQPKDPGVGMTALQSDIVFGVEEKAAEALPVAFDEPESEEFSQDVASRDIEIPEFVSAAPATPATPRVRPPRTTVRRECPSAALNAFPDRPTLANLPANTVPQL